jgi:hypothetical protein
MIAEPQGMAARRYSIMANGEPVTEITMPLIGPSIASPIAGRVYHLRRTGVLRESFTLEAAAGAAPVASATQRDPTRREYAIALDERTLTMRAESELRSGYLLIDGDQVVGSVRPAGALRRGIEATLPDDLPLEASVFLVWVVLFLWRGRRVIRAGVGG